MNRPYPARPHSRHEVRPKIDKGLRLPGARDRNRSSKPLTDRAEFKRNLSWLRPHEAGNAPDR